MTFRPFRALRLRHALLGLPLAAAAAVASSGRLVAQRAATDRPLTGVILDPTGAAIAGAEIRLTDTQGAWQRVTRSDGHGAFTFPAVSAGRLQLSASHRGFRTSSVALPDLLPSAGPEPPLRLVLVPETVQTSITVQGREDDLLGVADSATQGIVGAKEIAARPILRSGEVLEAIPGVIITQHAGGGKANQYFLRGFNLDHGTDFAVFLDGMPLNLPSHAHGEGYADMNTVIPELVERVSYEKGPYYAEVGNYGSAGAAHLEFFRTLPRDFVQVEGGTYGFGRLAFGASRPVGAGSLLYGGEAYHDDGPWVHPDNYFKFNGLATYSQGADANGFSLTARAYHGQWHSSDQIPDTAVPLVGLFGTLNPTDGGRSQRHSLQGEWHEETTNAETRLTGYGFYYDLDLFSDFTYFLTDPRLGDQFEQQDRRWVAGMDARHTRRGRWLRRPVETTFGLQLRNDWIHNGLYQSRNRVRTDKFDADSGTALPATTQEDRFTSLQAGFYAETRIQWAAHLRSVVAMRGDVQRFGVRSLVTAANGGTAVGALPSPKASVIVGPWRHTELYAQAGFGFHSNDGRGTTQNVEPVSADNPVPDTPATPIPALISTRGGEFGMRSAIVPHLQSTVSVWYLHSASELQQSGDTGGTTASRQPSERYGVEWANFYTPTPHWAVDFDLANSRALFTRADADDAAPGSPGGKRVPEAVGLVIASGVTLHDAAGFSASLRLRLFGPRDLSSDGLFRSHSTALVNGELGYRLSHHWTVSAEFLNLLNRRDHDIDYAYTSRVTPTAEAAFTDVFHPVEPFQTRFWLRRSF